MKLVPIYFEGESETGLHYRKALVYEQDFDFFASMGGTSKPMEPGEEFKDTPKPKQETPIDPDPDKTPKSKETPDTGFGKPGSFEWHKTNINGIKAKKDIVEYATKVVERDLTEEIDVAKNMNVVKLKALKIIKEFLTNGNEN